MEAGAEIERAFKLGKPAPLVIGYIKGKNMNDKMYFRIVGGDRANGRSHAAEVRVVDTKCDMKGLFHDLAK